MSSIKNEETVKVRLSLGDRLAELPYVVYRELKDDVIERSGVSLRTWYNVLGGTDNLAVISAMAQVLKCTIEQVLDPSHVFEDPRKIS